MMLFVAAIICGFILLVYSADMLVKGAAAVAKNLGVSSLVIGLTVVGLSTSAPEMLVSAVASTDGKAVMAIGNALGSNIANISLVLAFTAIVCPLTLHSSLIRKELPILLLASLSAAFFLYDGQFDRWEGYCLLVGLVLLLISMVYSARHSGPDELKEEFDEELSEKIAMRKALFYLLFGLIVLLGSSKLLVWSASELARMAGISELVIGLSVLAIGTSLPELAASVVSALKNEPDIAVGNVIGSNLFNLLAVLAIPGVLSPGLVPQDTVIRDLPVLLALTLVLVILGVGRRNRPGKVYRFHGIMLLSFFMGYQLIILT